MARLRLGEQGGVKPSEDTLGLGKEYSSSSRTRGPRDALLIEGSRDVEELKGLVKSVLGDILEMNPQQQKPKTNGDVIDVEAKEIPAKIQKIGN